MKLNSQIFQAIAIVNQALMVPSPLPHDPAHANNAKYIVEELLSACKGDPTLTLSAAHMVCGFLGNKTSAHCTPQELVAHAVTAVRNIIGAVNSTTQIMQAPPGPAQVAQTAVPPPVAQPLPSFPEPATPLEVPDFG